MRGSSLDWKTSEGSRAYLRVGRDSSDLDPPAPGHRSVEMKQVEFILHHLIDALYLFLGKEMLDTSSIRPASRSGDSLRS